MNGSNLVCVLTTIQQPTDCVRKLAQVLRSLGAALFVIGDSKTPSDFHLPGAEFFSLGRQKQLPFALAAKLPVGHYARKNLGYLLALERGAGCVYETDDDNHPGPGWHPRPQQAEVQQVDARPWMNVYRHFSDEHIWPRGFPLEQVNNTAAGRHDRAAPLVREVAPIQQGLANLAPDVDALWRLLLDREFYFASDRPSLWLPPGTWCPFNSQSTWWWPEAYPLLYLPSHCSFRMTDIWRSFVAQRCLWELGHGLVFHGPEVVQQRNVHNLLRDFRDELPGYLENQRLVDCLSRLRLRSGREEVGANLLRCYEGLIQEQFFPAEEWPLVCAWAADVERLAQDQHHQRAA